jgi:uncharacterized protein YgiM (DUF1202 family)
VKKTAAIVSAVLLLAAVQSARAGRGHYGHRHHFHGHHHGYYGDHAWAAWGFGVLTGAAVTYLFYPRPYTVVVPAPAATVVYQIPAVVEERRLVTTTPAYPSGSGPVQVAIGTLNMRSGPGTHHPVVDRVRYGEILTVIGGAPGWLYVRNPAGRHGWVMAQYTAQAIAPQG